MNLNYKKLFVLLMLQCALCMLHSQIIHVPYQYGFENDDPEEDNWELNIGSRGRYCNDRWVIGNLEHSEGSQALYISCDRGKTSTYGSEPNVVIASRIIELAGGNYDISFDWRVWGEEMVSELYVCALPEDYVANEMSLESNDTIGFFPKAFSRFIRELTTVDGTRQSLSGATTWSNASFPLSVIGGRKIQLAFVWVNANRDTLPSPLGACIDNIQINSAMCPRPENLTADASCGEINISWDGVGLEYECGYKRVGKKYWNNAYNIDGEVDNPSYSWDNVEEGAYDVRVRAIADGDTSAYVYLNTVIVWCPDNHCFDFVSLDNDEVVTCEAGGAISNPLTDPTGHKLSVVPPIDFGSNSIYSRHTTNWDQTELDPRTGNRLTLIPEDGLASVRLGNWNSGSEAERITYEYNVVDDVVLLMKYAVVLEAPGHGEALDPYFGLEILREDGSPITENSTCGEAFFSPDREPEKWRKSGAYVWKDWNTIGIDLRGCKGEKIKIQLTTQDCVNGAHGGYAYFTLDCVDATIKSDGCDTVSLEAPAGFNYLWRNSVNESFTSSEQKIYVPADDDSEYFCEVTYIDNQNCSFVLSSSVVPHHPKAQFEYSWEPANCNNIVKFNNTSYVYAIVDNVDSILEGKQCGHYEWEFEFNGTKEVTDLINARYTMPNEGGNLHVSLSAFLEDEKCFDVLDTIINVPAIHGHDIALEKELCWGDYEILGDNFIMESGVYVDTFPNVWGCDSIVTLTAYVRPEQEDVIVYDTLCSADPYVIGNYRFDETGVYEVMLSTNDELACDSVVILHLQKLEPIQVSVEDIYRHICADEEALYVAYEVAEGKRTPSSYSVTFDSLAISAGFVDVYDLKADTVEGLFTITIPDMCRPNTYTATIVVEDTISACGDILLPIEFDVYYSSKILETKFNNLITVLNSDSNGGYEFSDYKWFLNGELIPGENDPFLYLSEGTFATGDCYYLEVRRTDDGVIMQTCPICPGTTPVDNIYTNEPLVINTLVGTNNSIIIENLDKAMINMYTITGQLLESKYVDTNVAEVKAPSKDGVYLLQVVTSTDTFVTKIVVNSK